jgi:phage shock protein PspC (stress-responsive transcriptional regulator)
MIAGVAAGLGDYFDLDPVLFRVGFIVLAFFFGLAIPLYILAWILVPPAPGTRPTGRTVDRVSRQARQWPRWLSIAIVVVGLAVLFTRYGPGPNPYGYLRPSIVWGLALVLLGILLYRHANDRDAEPPPPGPGESSSPPADTVPMVAAPPAAAPAGAAWGIPHGTPVGPAWDLPETPTPPTTLTPPAAPPVAVAAPSPSRRHRQHSPLGWVTLGAALLALGVAAILDQSGALTIAPVRFPALALAVLGIGLLVGAVWGRARWLIVLGVLLIPFVLAASLIDVPIAGGVGQRFYQPATTSQLQPAYRLAVGQVNLDLRNVVFDSSGATVTASVAVGRLIVTVPSDAFVILHAAVGAGTIRVQNPIDGTTDRAQDGVQARLDQTFGSPSAPNQLVLNLREGFGEIDLFRAPPDQPQG